MHSSKPRELPTGLRAGQTAEPSTLRVARDLGTDRRRVSLLYSTAVGGRVIPLLVLLTVTLVLRAMGVAGVAVMDSWLVCVRGGLAAMFLLTASAHWGSAGRISSVWSPRLFRDQTSS